MEAVCFRCVLVSVAQSGRAEELNSPRTAAAVPGAHYVNSLDGLGETLAAEFHAEANKAGAEQNNAAGFPELLKVVIEGRNAGHKLLGRGILQKAVFRDGDVSDIPCEGG